MTTPDRMLIAAASGFEAARSVSLLPEGHRSARMHGHSFLARVRAALPEEWGSFKGSQVDDLTQALYDAVAPLDYRNLNEVLEQPTDENLARWLRRRLDVPGVVQVAIQSTQDEGVELDSRDHAHVWRRYRFEAAHWLPNVPAGHKCGRLHGHGFEIILHADQDLGAGDIGIDYDHLDKCWAPVYAQLHQTCLNDVGGLANPTSELIASWVWEAIKPVLPELSWVTCYETASSGAHYDGIRHRIWKELTLDSAVRLAHAGEDDPRRRVHGHTFTLRLHLNAPLDVVMGWTMDFGDVKALFDPIFKRLDHQPLHEIAPLGESDTPALARWIREQAAPLLPQLDRVDLYQTRGCGSLLSWGADGPALPV